MQMPNNLPEPNTRRETFLASAAGMTVETPTPITREEIYLDTIAKGGGSVDAYTKAQTDTLLATKADKTATGDNTDLTTTAKTTLVAAINEVNANIGDINTVLEEVL
jgi:hypothetical protein